MQNSQQRLSVKITAIFLVVFFSALVLEGMARLVFTYQEGLSGNSLLFSLTRSEMVMDPYELESSSVGGHWGLRPGYSYLNAKKTKFRINKYGLRGPEIDENHSRLRILSLGDSVTFGLDNVTYPGIIANSLNQTGLSVEVINGGVEGYRPRNLLYEIDRYLDLRPEVVTIFIGWNALYSPTLWLEKQERFFRLPWFIRNLSISLQRRFIGEQVYARKMLERIPEPNAKSADVIYAADYSPPFLGRVEELVERFQKGGSQVYLMTLPGLFVSDEKPSDKALKMGHFPTFSSNPFVLAEITERYNQSLRNLAVRRGAGLIDLELWSKRHLIPRDEFFTDSVHLTGEGLARIGEVIAEQLEQTIGKEQVQ